MTITMKALGTFRGAKEGKVYKGSKFTVADVRRAEELERVNLAVRTMEEGGGKAEAAPQNKMEKGAPQNKMEAAIDHTKEAASGMEEGQVTDPLESGGQTGADNAASSLPPERVHAPPMSRRGRGSRNS